jgi:hypothetical protein
LIERMAKTLLQRLPAPFAARILLALLFCATTASAQLIDTVDVSHDGANAIVRIRFGALIQYLRHVPVNEGSVVEVFFQITARDEAAEDTREEQRFPPKNQILPGLSVTYPAQAPGVQRRLTIQFGKPVRFRLRPEDARTIVVTIPLSDDDIARLVPPKPKGAALPPSEVTATPQTDVDRDAYGFFRQAREALESANFDEAVVRLNRLLNLPPNPWSQEAQELIGIAREQLGETTKAKAEMELYLKLYPDGAGAQRVRQQLAALAAAPVADRAPAARPPATSYWGSLSMYYYGGQSRSQTTTTVVTPATGATTIDTAALSGVDQSQLVNSVDLTGRYRDAIWDNRAVVRDSYMANFLSGSSNSNQLNALYADFRHQPTQLGGRVGRQNATSGGVLGLFDGAIGSWGLAPNWRLNAVAGKPVNVPADISKSFYGANVDLDRLGERWSGNIFAIRQLASGTDDRTAVGGELRYFDPERNVYALVDYDTTFRATNIGMVQGNWQFPTGTAFTALWDFRRTPTLQLSNALIGEPSGSFDAMIDALGLSGTRNMAKAVTPISRVVLVGVTQQFSPRWQLGFDYRISSLSGTPATPTLPAVPVTGNIYTYTLQGIANGLTPWQDILVVNGSMLNGRLSDAVQVGFDFRFTPFQAVLIEPMLKWYRQTDTQNQRLTRTTPGLKIVWQIRERFALEAQFEYEISKTRSPVIVDDVRRHFYYIGWRWDL